MTPLPLDHWNESLAGMESSLTASLKALDRSEERWERAAAPSAGEGEEPAALERLDARLREWEARLRESEELAAAVGKEIAERSEGVERWRGLFAAWAELIKRQPVASPAP